MGIDRPALAQILRQRLVEAWAEADDPQTVDVTAEQTRSRAAAPFVTQLIATSLGLPETRAKRRAEPDVADQRYRAARGTVWPAPTTQRYDRSA